MVAARLKEHYAAAAKEHQQQHGHTAPGKAKSLQVNLPEVNSQARDKEHYRARAKQRQGERTDLAVGTSAKNAQKFAEPRMRPWRGQLLDGGDPASGR